MRFLLGLTGSIGMGKTTTAQMFRERGVPVWDADAAVHRMYAAGGAAVPLMQTLRPQAIVQGAVDRTALKEWIAEDTNALAQIESVVHPLVAKDRAAWIAQTDADILVVDVPLLFETGGETRVDAVAVVSAPADMQRARVLARPNMTEAQFDAILAKQMPDAEKRARATYIIDSRTLDSAAACVDDILTDIRRKLSNA